MKMITFGAPFYLYEGLMKFHKEHFPEKPLSWVVRELLAKGLEDADVREMWKKEKEVEQAKRTLRKAG